MAPTIRHLLGDDLSMSFPVFPKTSVQSGKIKIAGMHAILGKQDIVCRCRRRNDHSDEQTKKRATFFAAWQSAEGICRECRTLPMKCLVPFLLVNGRGRRLIARRIVEAEMTVFRERHAAPPSTRP